MDFLKNVDVVIVAIKPQAFDGFIESLKDDELAELSKKVIVSIMVGKTIEHMSKLTGSSRVVRSMPNLPALIGQGLTGWLSSTGCSYEDKELVKKVFQSFGEEVELDNEGKIDAITALSGSGPGYYFYLTELIQNKAMEMGFSDENAKKIAETTFAGAGEFLVQSDKLSAEWVKIMTSIDGTTAAGIKHMIDNEVGKTFKGAIQKANDRSEELGK